MFSFTFLITCSLVLMMVKCDGELIDLIVDYPKNFTIGSKLNEPTLHCRSNDLLVFEWENEGDPLNILEISNGTYIEIQNDTFYCLNNLNDNTIYKIRLWQIFSNLTISKSDFKEYKTLKSGELRMPVEKLYLEQLVLENYTYNAEIRWKSSEEKSCFYDLVWFEVDTDEDYRQESIVDLKHSFEYTIGQLKFEHNYSISIAAVDSKWSGESAKTFLNILTPTCLETYKNISKCNPETPQGLVVNEKYDGDTFQVHLHWDKPEFTPNYYTASLLNLVPLDGNRTYLNVSGNEVEATFTNQNLGKYYQVTLTAYSDYGPSKEAFTNQYTNIKLRKNNKFHFAILSFIISLLLLGLAIILIHKIARSLTIIRKPMDLVVEHTKAPDEWELQSDDLEIEETLGEGAFGVVRKGWLKKNVDNSVPVAIKSMKLGANESDLQNFQREIEIMKNVGYHPNLVSIVGCVLRDPQNPLLVVEYCPRGDLQTYLREIWESQSGTTYFNNFFMNKSYCYLTSTEVLSFASQIVSGMEYLSSIHVLHRDLAARNILITDDLTAKVSDFGLSRDVYNDDIYMKMNVGRLPIRWLALESITHQVYTTKSDVWSFGILLWEIVTLGGNPYSNLSPYEVVTFLKSGKRMDKPTNCSDELYEIMIWCWNENPKKRPSFTDLKRSFEELTRRSE